MFKAIAYLDDFEDIHIRSWLRLATSRALSSGFGGLFSATAILYIAERLDTDCDGRINIGPFNWRISSLLAISSVMENSALAFLAPTFGALGDSRYDRKHLLIFSCFIWVGLFFVSALSLLFTPSISIFFFFSTSVIILRIFYELFLVLLFAYLPEVAKTEDEINALSSRNYGIIKTVQLFATIFITLLTIIFSNTFTNDLPYTVIAHFMVVLWFCYFGIPGIRGLPEARRKSQAETNAKVFSVLKETILEIRKEFHSVAWFLIAFTMYFSAILSVISLKISFVREVFDFRTREIGSLAVITLIFAALGAFSVERLAKRIKLKTILFSAILLYGTLTLFLPFLLFAEDVEVINASRTTDSGCVVYDSLSKKPTSTSFVLLYLFSATLGYLLGLVYPVNIAIYSQILPGGRETTYFALKHVCAVGFGWVPPLVFAIVNERTGNIKVALSSISIFFFLSLPFISFINVEKGKEEVEYTLKNRNIEQNSSSSLTQKLRQHETLSGEEEKFIN